MMPLEFRGILAVLPALLGTEAGTLGIAANGHRSTRGCGARQQAPHFPLVSSCQTRFEDPITVGAADRSGAGVLLAPSTRAAWEPDERREQREGVGRGGTGNGGS